MQEKLLFKVFIINDGVLISIQKQTAKTFDLQGNVVTNYKILIGDDTRIEKLLKDVPTKFTIEVEQMEEGTPLIKALVIDF